MKVNRIQLKEKTIAGICARTSNTDPQMGEKIGLLWKALFESELPLSLSDRIGTHSFGLYSDYEADVNGHYDITAGFEIGSPITQEPQSIGSSGVCHPAIVDGASDLQFAVKTIPAGNYAEFIAKGTDLQAVANLWQEIWQLPLERTYTGDFEEYIPGPDGQTVEEIRIYIAVK